MISLTTENQIRQEWQRKADAFEFPYHPDYGLPDTYRSQVVAYVQTHGINLAATEFNLHPSTVYRWVRTQKETN